MSLSASISARGAHSVPTPVRMGTVLLALLLTGLTAGQARADEPIIRVEEDWGIFLNEPNDSIEAPQFHTVMSPFEHLNASYAQLTWNYRELPDFQAGGLQLQSWNGDHFLSKKSSGSEPMSSNAELVLWTQVLETDGSKLALKVVNGSSTTWGAFGGDDVKVEWNTSVNNLAGYSSDVSVKNSYVTYGSNRVEMLAIIRIRRYSASGLVSTDHTTKVVFDRE